MKHIALSSALVLTFSSGCGKAVPPPALTSHAPSIAREAPSTRIQHVVVVVEDSRTFDNLFATFPGADGQAFGFTQTGRRVKLHETTFRHSGCGIPDDAASFHIASDNGRMNGFDELDKTAPLCPYARIAQNEIKPYWDLAKRYVLADHTFASTYEGDFVNRQYLIAGSTRLRSGDYVIGNPTQLPYGCDAPAGTRASVITPKGAIRPGPFPCFSYLTIAERLDASKISWRAYTGTESVDPTLDPYDAIQYVREGPDWKTDVISPESRIVSDLEAAKLAQVSWVFSNGSPSWLASIVTAAQKSSYWPHLAIVVVWPSGGMYYDHVPPPQTGQRLGPGQRVPMIVISPYAKPGFVSHTMYETGGSTLRFIEETFGLRSLGATDVDANSIGNCLEAH